MDLATIAQTVSAIGTVLLAALFGYQVTVLHIAGPVSAALDGGTVQKMDTPEGPGIGISGPSDA